MASEPTSGEPVKPQSSPSPASQPEMQTPAWWSPSRVPGALLIAVIGGLIVLVLLEIIHHVRLIWI